jgi:hypothetical protein
MDSDHHPDKGKTVPAQPLGKLAQAGIALLLALAAIYLAH